MIDELAKAIYALIPDGGIVRRPTTDPSNPWEKVFVADPWDEIREERKSELRGMARAVLTRLREPTPGMIAAIPYPPDRYDPDDTIRNFRAMIDAAIPE